MFLRYKKKEDDRGNDIIQFSFKYSHKLHRFFNKRFDLLYFNSDEEGQDQIILRFNTFKYPHYCKARIIDGAFSLQKRFPPSTLNYILKNKKYALLKYYSLMPEHKPNLRDKYDVLLTFNKNIIGQLYKDFEIRTYDDSEAYNTRRLYISRKEFNDFLTSTRDKIFITHRKKPDDKIKVIFDESIYNTFLKEIIKLPVEKIYALKVSSDKGFSSYYSYIEEFLTCIKSEDIKFTNKNQYIMTMRATLEDINLENYDFSLPVRRRISEADVKIFFLKNHDLLITRDMSLKVDINKDSLNEEINELFSAGYKKYKSIYEEKISNKEFKLIIKKDYDKLLSLISKTRLNSQNNFDVNFYSDLFYFFSIINLEKKIKNSLTGEMEYISLLRDRFKGYEPDIYEAIPIILSVHYVYSKYFPKDLRMLNKIFATFEELSNDFKINETELNKIAIFISNFLLLYEVAEDLKYLKNHFIKLFENEKDINEIIKLSHILIKSTFKWAEASHNILSASAFSMFLLGLNYEKIISLSSICQLEQINILQYSLSREILKIIAVSNDEPQDFDFENLKIINPETKKMIREIIIKITVQNFISFIKKNMTRKDINILIKDLISRLEFFFRFPQFQDQLSKIKLEILEFLNLFNDFEIKNIITQFKERVF